MVDNVESDGVVISLNDKLSAWQPLSSGCCIYGVPENFHKVNEDAYHPWVVSIGPFHHNDAKLKPMQEQKLRYLQSLLEHNEDKNLDHYVQLVRERQEDIRNCYDQQIEIDDDTFVEMVLLDGAFIIEFMSRSVNSGEMDFIGYSRNLMNLITIFVLNEIYNLANSGAISFNDIAIANMVNNYGQPIQYMTANTEIKHFVDLLRLSFLLSTPETKPNQREDDHNMTNITFSVTELHEAGLKFKVSTSEILLDISFNNEVLQIPRLPLTDDTEILFRNLVVFEQFYPYPNHIYIRDYIIFLNGLINTAKDVDILVQKGIIYNWLGNNEEAAKLINSLGTNIMIYGDNYLEAQVFQSSLGCHFSSLCNSASHSYRFTSYNWFYSNKLTDSQPPQPINKDD